MTDHKHDAKPSVEQNLSNDYVPKGKLGDLPISNSLTDAAKKKSDKIQRDIEKFKDEIIKKFKFVEAVGIVPAQAAKAVEEEYEISEVDVKRHLVHVLMVIPEKQFKNLGKVRLEAINVAKDINDKLWVHVMTPVDVWNLGLDSKFEVMEALSMSYPLHDKGLLAALRVSQIHKSLVLRKFEKYVTSYVIAGSLTRGEATKTSDVDVFIVIDDTDVKRMPRLELKEKLRGIIFTYIQEAQAMAGVKNVLNVQPYLLTEFWDAVKDAHPVMFTFIRDGVPLYDRGAFLPWKSLLRMGKIKPSPEAIDMFMSSGNKLKETVDKRVFDIATLDLFWGISTPTQGLLMLYGMAPPTPKETVKLFREIFYEKEKLVEKEYVEILEEIMIKVWKGYEHGKIKAGDISGTELDRLAGNAIKYIKRIQELREQIDKRMQEKSIEETYLDLFGLLGSFTGKKGEAAIIRAFEKDFVGKGHFPPRFIEHLKFIAKMRTTVQKKQHSAKKKENLTTKQGSDVATAQRFATEIINAVVEYSQRIDLARMDKSRFVVKGRNMQGEILFLQVPFLVTGNKIQKIIDGKLVDSSAEELRKSMSTYHQETKIDFKALQVLEKMFGDFELLQ